MDFNDPNSPDLEVPTCTLAWQTELPEAVICLALSPQGKLAAVGTCESEIHVLDVGSGEVRFRLAGHEGGTNALAFLGGNTLASVGEDGRARLWNVGRQACTHELAIDAVEPDKSPTGFTVSHLAVHPSGRCFACAAGRSVVQFTLPDARPGSAGGGGAAAAAEPLRRAFPALPSTVEDLRFDRRGNLVAAYYGGVTYWNLKRSEEQKQALDLPYQGACLTADASPAGGWLVAGCHDASVHIWHLKGHEDEGVHVEEMECGGYDGKVSRVDFDREGHFMASAGGERCIVWDFSKSPAGSVPTLTLGHRKSISCLGWQPDGSLLATGGRDGRVYIYDVSYAVPQRGGPSICLPGALADKLGDEASQLVWSRDGKILTGYLSGFMRLWELPLEESDEEEEEEGEAKAGAGGSAARADS